MITGLSGNLKLSIGAKYVAEDTAAYLLYRFDRSSLDGSQVHIEKFAKFLGLAVECEYICGDCTQMLGIAAYEPQRIYTESGAVDLSSEGAVIERDIIDRGQFGLYRLAVAYACAECIFYAAKHGENSPQTFFGLDTVESTNRRILTFDDFTDSTDSSGGGVSNFALKLLMPKNGFKRTTVETYARLGINRATAGEHLPEVLNLLSESYGVPEGAALARMRQLNLC